MQAFHNDLAIKQKYLDRVLAHQKADEIEKGYYWKNGKGCAEEFEYSMCKKSLQLARKLIEAANK